MLIADSIARFAGLLADRSRAALCLALLDGRARTTGELARHVGVAAPTARAHLTLLVGAGLLAEDVRAGTATTTLPVPSGWCCLTSPRREALDLRDGLALTADGRAWFTSLAGDTALPDPARRPPLRICLDWTEHGSHPGGALGALFCSQFQQRS